MSTYWLEYEYTAYARPRFSRTSWKSRDELEPPRIVSSTRSTKRRSSPREIPGEPRQRWYCSVCCDRKHARGPVVEGAGSNGSAEPDGAAKCRSTSSTTRSCSRLPAAVTTRFEPT